MKKMIKNVINVFRDTYDNRNKMLITDYIYFIVVIATIITKLFFVLNYKDYQAMNTCLFIFPIFKLFGSHILINNFLEYHKNYKLIKLKMLTIDERLFFTNLFSIFITIIIWSFLIDWYAVNPMSLLGSSVPIVILFRAIYKNIKDYRYKEACKRKSPK